MNRRGFFGILAAAPVVAIGSKELLAAAPVAPTPTVYCGPGNVGYTCPNHARGITCSCHSAGHTHALMGAAATHTHTFTSCPYGLRAALVALK